MNIDQHTLYLQAAMGRVLDALCEKAGLQWNSAMSGKETFVTLTRQGVSSTMTPTPYSAHYTRPPGTIAMIVLFLSLFLSLPLSLFLSLFLSLILSLVLFLLLSGAPARHALLTLTFL